MSSSPSLRLARVLGGRYLFDAELASGGMGTVHLGLLLGPAGFSRTVAIKRLHPQFAKDAEVARMFVDEAKLAARVRHPNVVPTVDVVTDEGEPFLVMEYVHGESLAALIRTAGERNERIPPEIAAAIVAGALHGLQAAHDARDEKGERLDIIHRDVTPQNVLVGVDGVARVLDFGIAKAAGRSGNTREGEVKGKLGYMAPEQFKTGVSIASDIYGAGVCLWEALTAQRLFSGDNESVVLAKVLAGIVVRPSKRAPDVPAPLDDVTLRALARDPAVRFSSAREMANALEANVRLAPPTEVGGWVAGLAADALASRAGRVSKMEAESLRAPVPQKAARRRLPPAAWIAVGAAAALAVVLAFAAVAPDHGIAPQGEPAVASTTSPLLEIVEVPSAAAVSSAAEPTIELAAGEGTQRARVPTRSTKPLVRHPPTPPAAPGPCAEPYTLDADGLKHYKKECLR
ncbi:MAG: serine/threonine-protein kinase [Polyangiaceae bacterium]